MKRRRTTARTRRPAPYLAELLAPYIRLRLDAQEHGGSPLASICVGPPGYLLLVQCAMRRAGRRKRVAYHAAMRSGGGRVRGNGTGSSHQGGIGVYSVAFARDVSECEANATLAAALNGPVLEQPTPGLIHRR